MAEQFFAAIAVHGFATLALVSVALSFIAFLPYIFDTLRGRTRPDRASWLIWTFLGVIAVVSLLYEGGGYAVWFMAVQAGMTGLVFLISIWRGAGSYLSVKNMCIFAAATFGLGLWYLLETSVYTLALVIVISALGAVPTIQKAARQPESETSSTWFLSGIAAACGTVSVGSFDLVQLAYPAYLTLLYCAIIWAMWMGRSANRRVRSWPVPEISPVTISQQPVFETVRQKPRLTLAYVRRADVVVQGDMADRRVG